MRIISGKYRGKKLTPLPESLKHIRPTTDRVKESIFNVLLHNDMICNFDGLRCLDIFSGTGALGLEALSRGADYVSFIDYDHQALSICKLNIKKLAAELQTSIMKLDVSRSLPICSNPYHLIFMDPPYGMLLEKRTIDNLIASHYLADGAILVLETEKKTILADLNEKLEVLMEKCYGKTKITFFKFHL